MRRAAWIALVAAGCVALATRPLYATVVPPTLVVIALFGALLAVGLSSPTRAHAQRRVSVTVPLAIGVAAFAAGRLVAGGEAPAVGMPRVVLLLVLAAVAEEAFFRRLVFDLLAHDGETLALVGSAALFAVVHVGVYGWWVLPVDMAAGLLLSWQRWASGSWRVPAATHVVANLLVVL